MENTEGNGGPQADFVGERELQRIDRELKEIGPQADCFGERELFTHSIFSAVFIKLRKFFATCLLIAVLIKLRKCLMNCNIVVGGYKPKGFSFFHRRKN